MAYTTPKTNLRKIIILHFFSLLWIFNYLLITLHAKMELLFASLY